MFTTETIEYLKNLVGWDDPNNDSIVVSDANLESTSGRIFKAFHSVVTVENVIETNSLINPSEEQLNAVLLEFKEQGAYQLLNKVFDNSREYQTDYNYYDTIVKYNGLLSEVMGMAVAVLVLNMMLHSKRINHTERTSKYSMLKSELEGYRDQYGRLLSHGAISLLERAIDNAKETIFPTTLTVEKYDW